ncbi:uncharacterized protein LOC143923706 isoform X1 [Lithobates pipiens]
MNLAWGLLLLAWHQSEAALEIFVSNKTAKVDSNVTLPCTFSWGNAPINTTLLQIIWIFKDQFVLTYCNKLTVNENRASMKTDQLKNGIASLMLSKVLTTDDGIYKCVVIYDKVHKEGIVSLHVEGMTYWMPAALCIVILATAILLGGGMWCCRICKNKRFDAI